MTAELRLDDWCFLTDHVLPSYKPNPRLLWYQGFGSASFMNTERFFPSPSCGDDPPSSSFPNDSHPAHPANIAKSIDGAGSSSGAASFAVVRL